jgi:hypothetical protein
MNEPFRDRAIFAPQILLTGYITVLLFAVTIFLSRAPMRRVVAAAAAGLAFAATLLTKARIGQPLRWRSDIPGVSDAFSLAPPIILLLPVFCLGGVLALVLWRVVRRFGTRGGIVLTFAVGVAGATRDRIVLPAMSLLEVNPGMTSFLADAVTWTAGLTVAAIVMRAMGGPATRDALARSIRLTD